MRSLAASGLRNIADQGFLAKIEDLRHQLENEGPAGAVLLIGLKGSGPFTILDGNHRAVAAMLIEPDIVSGFRFFCGLSPRMAECCWYDTNLATLLRYGKNLLKHLVYDPRAELARMLERS